MMIATGQFLDMLHRLENKADEARKEMDRGCISKYEKEGRHRFFDGYELAIRDMHRELENEL